MTILVTGGAGFIGSAVVRHLIRRSAEDVVTLDKLTYAGNLASLEEAKAHPRHHFEQVDICDGDALARVFRKYLPDAVLHLAAESHVDRSIEGPAAFIHTNVVGTYTLLEAARRHWMALDGASRDRFRFLHVSTDEVYGTLGPTGAFHEELPYRPNSPYSASKAASDHLVRAWHHTYGLPVVTTNCSNNYGPFQFPEKLIPLMILNAVDGRPLPVYGDGGQVRDWLYVDDHVEALLAVLRHGRVGVTYNIGGQNELTNLAVVREICRLVDELAPSELLTPRERLIRFVPDRPGHDRRYAMCIDRIANELKWTPRETFSSGLRRTVGWYLGHTEWCADVLSGSYRRERLGLPS